MTGIAVGRMTFVGNPTRNTNQEGKTVSDNTIPDEGWPEIEPLQRMANDLAGHYLRQRDRADAAESALRQVREDHDDLLMSLASLAEDEFATDETADLPDEGVVFEQGAMWAFAEASRLLTAILDSARVGAADTQPERAGVRHGSEWRKAMIERVIDTTPTAGSNGDTAPEADQ